MNVCHHVATSSAVDSFGVLTIVMLLVVFGFIGICIWLAVCGRCRHRGRDARGHVTASRAHARDGDALSRTYPGRGCPVRRLAAEAPAGPK